MTTRALWAALATLLCTALGHGRAHAQYVDETSINFNTLCGTAIADNDPAWSNKRYLLTGSEFFACGIELIASPGAALGDGAYLYRPSANGGVDTIGLVDPIAGLDNTALIGNVGTGIGPIEITFRTPVNELAFTLLDLDNGGSPTITVTDGNGVTSTPTFTVAGNQVSFSQQFPGGVKKLSVDYGGALENYALENLVFNTWDCGDDEHEPEAGEACDDGNAVQCDTCGNDCQVTIDGCLDGATCVADGTIQTGSGGCAVCDLSQRVSGSEVGYTNAALDTACDSDGLTCTDDLCSANGVCQHRIQDGTCAVSGTCYVDGDEQPGNVCNECDSSASKTSFTAVALGKTCDDGLFCTDSDICNGSGSCVGVTLDCSDTAACTTDTCDEANDTCVNTIAVGCLISGACVANGEKNPVNPCELCDRDSTLTDWTTLAAGTRCGDPECLGGVLTPAPECNASGTCEEQESVTCDGAVCANEESCTGACQSDDDCLEQNHCVNGACVPDVPNGEPCDRATQCESGFCADGVCCNAACDRACESCTLDGKIGMCEGYEAGTDPEEECPDAQICVSAGECRPENRPDGTMCDRDAVCASGDCVDGVCCDTRCDGVCEACNVASKEGTCTSFDIGSDQFNECSGEQVCNGKGACVGYETRGNGLCAISPASSRTSTAWWLAALGLLGLARTRRRRS